METSLIIAGAAGDGINTLSALLEKIFKRRGFEIFSYKNYMSRVRGGYNFTTMRITEKKVFSLVEKADFLIALNAEGILNASSHLKEGGLLLTSPESFEKAKLSLGFGGEDKLSDQILLIEHPQLKEMKKSKIMAFAGALLALLKIELEEESLFTSTSWTEEIKKSNLDALKLGYFGVDETPGQHLSLQKREERKSLLMSGNQGIALGALAAGLSFYSAYPMAPSTSIMSYLAKVEEEASIVVEQAEDEIAAIISAIGASSNGVRAMTGTSGGGFSLMVEGLGFAAVAETPLVIANVQRPGPATGLPTRTEQADFSFAAYASQGEFSRILLAPTDVEDCFYTTFRAFNLADKYQCPVILLSDQLLADTVCTVDTFELQGLEIQRYLDLDLDKDYKRYAFDRIQGGRKYPGLDDRIIMTDSHVHDEYGYITEEEDAAIRLKDKFLKRNEAISQELEPPKLLLREGESLEDIHYLLLGWGSTAGALRDALPELKGGGVLLFRDLFPLAETVLDPYRNEKIKLISVEANGTSQFANYLKMLTGVRFFGGINKYDGRPFSVEYIVEKMRKLLEEKDEKSL